MFRKLLVIIMVLCVATAAYATSRMQHHGKGFDCYSSTNGGNPCPCPCPGMKKGDTPCPMMKDGGTSAPCPMMKQGSAPCGKDCMKKCEKCPQAKDCTYRKDCMNRKKDGAAPCMSRAKQPCPYVKDATK